MSRVYSPATKQLLDDVRRELPQALLLTGDEGMGLLSTALDLAGHTTADIIRREEGSPVIKVEQIRALIQTTRGKSRRDMRYIIEDADKLSVEAQNAFLKLLEEPNPHTSFILTSHDPLALLPTILSRVQTLQLGRITTAQSTELISAAGVTDPRKTQQLLFLADGRPAELTRLIQDEDYFSERAKIIASAREFIQGTPYQKAMIVQAYANDRTRALELVSQALTIIQFSLKQTPRADLIATAERLTLIYDRLVANGNVRLQLTTFVV